MLIGPPVSSAVAGFVKFIGAGGGYAGGGVGAVGDIGTAGAVRDCAYGGDGAPTTGMTAV